MKCGLDLAAMIVTGLQAFTSREIVQQCPSRLEIHRLKAFREAPANASQQIACVRHLALIATPSCKAGRRAQFPREHRLSLREVDRLLEIRCRSVARGGRAPAQHQLALDSE